MAKPTPLNEAAFAEQHAASAMASELLQQGIDGFIAAREELAVWLAGRYAFNR
jgi:transaldolase